MYRQNGKETSPQWCCEVLCAVQELALVMSPLPQHNLCQKANSLQAVTRSMTKTHTASSVPPQPCISPLSRAELLAVPLMILG